MPSLWVIFAVAAGGFQSLRTAMQHNLRDRFSLNSAALIRHLFGFPYVAGFCWAYMAARDQTWPAFGESFGFYALAAALLQVVGTLFLIHSFTDRGYLVGSAFAKTEAVQAAIAAAILFGERLGFVTWCGILIGVSGVLVVALHGRIGSLPEIVRAIGQPAAAYGLGAAALLAATGLVGKQATAQVKTADPITAALFTVGMIMLLQIALQAGWMAIFRRTQLKVPFIYWKDSMSVGLVSASGSIAWFASLAIAPVALVRIVGQTEAVFTVALSRFFLDERPHRNEVFGLALVATGVLLAMWGGWHR